MVSRRGCGEAGWHANNKYKELWGQHWVPLSAGVQPNNLMSILFSIHWLSPIFLPPNSNTNQLLTYSISFFLFFLGIKQILRLYSTSNHKKIMIKITVIMVMSKITVKRGHYTEDKVHINRDLPSYSWGCELAMEPHGNSENFCNIQGRLLDPCLEDCFGYPPPKVGKR